MYANNKGADHHVHPHSLLSVFVICFLSIIATLVPWKKINILFCLCSCAGWFEPTWFETPQAGFLESVPIWMSQMRFYGSHWSQQILCCHIKYWNKNWFGSDFVCLIWYFTSKSTIFQLCRDGSSWVEPVLSKDYCVFFKDTTQWPQWSLNSQHLDLKSSTLPLSHCDMIEQITTSDQYLTSNQVWPCWYSGSEDTVFL